MIRKVVTLTEEALNDTRIFWFVLGLAAGALLCVITGVFAP